MPLLAHPRPTPRTRAAGPAASHTARSRFTAGRVEEPRVLVIVDLAHPVEPLIRESVAAAEGAGAA